MKYLPRIVFGCSLFAMMPVLAQAAGTYYNGNYQSPQTMRYNTSSYGTRTNANIMQNSAYQRTYSNSGYNNSNYNSSSYAASRQNMGQNMGVQRGTMNSNQNQARGNQANSNVANSARNGFYLDAAFSHQMAQWQFEMKEAGSILHYDNVGWNVFGADAAYVFDMGSMKGQIDAGLQYGMQSGESSMVDDDVTRGGYLVTTWVDGSNNVIGEQIGHALSVGKSSGGNMLGFNVGFGLTDVFSFGKVRITPSVGYRYLKYKLETSQNYGMSIDTLQCFEVDGEIQCDPILIFGNTVENGVITDPSVPTREDINSLLQTGGGAYVNTAGTYYYQQPGVSHSYEVEWAGPYLAFDMDYQINQTNAVNGRLELGFPGYTAIGDQPYRFDWAHPKSIEDKAGMFGAFHLGMGANWMTAITDTVSLTLGMTYDYYSVSDADATTYLNGTYYTDLYDYRLENLYAGDEDRMLEEDAIAKNIVQLEQDCPGWVCKSDGEIESFYKSIGLRIGINARF